MAKRYLPLNMHSLFFLLIFLLGFSSAKAAVNISFDGCVEKPQMIHYQSKVSLFQLLNDAEVDECAYLFGASWQKKSLLAAQLELKASVLKDIAAMLQMAETESEILYLANLQKLVEKQQVTGRVVATDFEPFHVEMLPLKNRVVVEDSTFYFPEQPNFINMLGFEKNKSPYSAESSIDDIYQTNPICDDCQEGWLWLVQPNGLVEKRKVGIWTHERFYLAPGGWLISELSAHQFSTIAPGFYQKLTQWLSTQGVH